MMPTRMPSQPIMWERKSRGRKETLPLNLRSERSSSSPFGPGFAILEGCCSVMQLCLKWQVSLKGGWKMHAVHIRLESHNIVKVLRSPATKTSISFSFSLIYLTAEL